MLKKIGKKVNKAFRPIRREVITDKKQCNLYVNWLDLSPSGI